MGSQRIGVVRAAERTVPAASPAVITEPGRPHPQLLRFVPPAAAAALLGRLAHGRQMGAALEDLQRYRGNRYVGGVVQAMRDGPRVGSPDDRCEREADRLADQVTAPGSAHAVIERPAGAAAHRPTVARGGGRPLPAPVRAPFEQALGEDFGDVRVHTDSGADRLARGMGAVAFTTGPDIFFRCGRYDPGAQPGRRLLAHELGHVVQQRGMAAPPIQRKMGLEYEVDDIRTRRARYWGPYKGWAHHDAGDFMMARTNYDITADIATGTAVPYSRIEFKTRAFDETDQAEVAKLMAAVTSILGDIQAIKDATKAHPQPGYGAGSKWWLLGGEQGWFGRDEWVGLDEIPRLRGPWYHQVTYAGSFAKDAVGTLQLTGGFSLQALQRLVSGEQLGNLESWPAAARRDWRQYVHGYARQRREAPQLYQSAFRAVMTHRLHRGGRKGSAGMMAAILAVMAQLPLSQRAARYDVGSIIAKTDYAKLLSMARDEGMQFGDADLLQALLDVVNGHLVGTTIDGSSPVIPGTTPPDLSKVSLRQWVQALVPAQKRGAPSPVDLMTKANYPGTPGEKIAMRAFGPYRHADPFRGPGGDRAIFELRSIMSNPTQDLRSLVTALKDLMLALHRLR